jgi:CubicO group peptidase (beta-lactamase class C family)
MSFTTAWTGLVLLSIAAVGLAQTAPEPKGGDTPAADKRAALDDLDALVPQALDDFNVPGLGIAIVSGGEIIYAKGFGHRDVANSLPLTTDTLFAIGSTTKAMTATVLGMLVDDGKLDWDTPLRTYLPEFTLSDSRVSDRITPRDLLTHRSGLPRHDLLWYNHNKGSRAEMVSRLAHLELSADLREKFQYNNLMFITAGYLTERLTDNTWESAVWERLFVPLGMTRSNFSVTDSQADPDHALPYREKDDEQTQIPFRPIDLVGPAGSVNSSVNEMARWLMFNLAHGRVGERQLINRTTLADIQAPHMTVESTSTRPDIISLGYGMGWGLSMHRGHRLVSHGGGIDGFSTSVMLFPDDDLGLVAFVNTGSGLASLVNRHAAEMVLGLDAEDWIGEARERRGKAREVGKEAEQKREDNRITGTRPSHAIADYVGSYHHPGYGTLAVSESSGRHALKVTFNGISAPLRHWHYDVWQGGEAEDGSPTFKNTRFLFRSNYDGQISAVEAPFEVLASPITFDKQPDPRLSDPAYLERYVAAFEGQVDKRAERIELKGNRLTLTVAGQPTYTLVPLVSGRFAIQGLEGFSVGFEEDRQGVVTKVVYYRPNGVFESIRVK